MTMKPKPFKASALTDVLAASAHVDTYREAIRMITGMLMNIPLGGPCQGRELTGAIEVEREFLPRHIHDYVIVWRISSGDNTLSIWFGHENWNNPDSMLFLNKRNLGMEATVAIYKALPELVEVLMKTFPNVQDHMSFLWVLGLKLREAA